MGGKNLQAYLCDEAILYFFCLRRKCFIFFEETAYYIDMIGRLVLDMSKLMIKRVDADPNLDRFDCGNGSLNNKIKDGYYTTLLKQGYAYEICLNGIVIGYYMLRLVSLDYESDYLANVSDSCFSAIKLEYLAIDRSYQRMGNGTAVLKYIVQLAKEYSERLPIRFLSLDALTEKIEWYVKRGFQLYTPINLAQSRNTVPMYMDFCDANAVKLYCNSCE